MIVLGIDIGGSGIKGAPVDTETGELTADRCRIPTPQPARPSDVADVVAEVAQEFNWNGPIGITFPAVVRRGIVHTAANVSKTWIGVNGRMLLEQRTGCPVTLLNDADAAGIAEMRFGAGQGQDGVVIIITLGTGIGSAIFVNGHLMPNSELGHLEREGESWELYAASRARKEEGLKWREWAARVDSYFQRLSDLFSPDLIIAGGGVSKKHKKWLPLLTVDVEVVPAQLRNAAGIIGAAYIARSLA